MPNVNLFLEWVHEGEHEGIVADWDILFFIVEFVGW